MRGTAQAVPFTVWTNLATFEILLVLHIYDLNLSRKKLKDQESLNCDTSGMYSGPELLFFIIYLTEGLPYILIFQNFTVTWI